VVGGGTAGCVLATRLSEDDSVQVLLIEAGPAEGSVSMADPSGWVSLLGTEVDWSFTTVPQTGLGGVELSYPAGKVLGGSSSINATIHLRGHRANYDAWVESGAAGWSYEDLLPYFMRSERAAGRDPRVRGMEGPMLVAPRPRTPDGALIEDLFAAALDAGIPITEDPNGTAQDGAGWNDWNIVNGKRQSAADAYLRPVLGRPNLNVVTDARVRRLIIENGRCRGVEYAVGSRSLQADAVSEVVLAAGTIGSAKLLMTSGIGPASHLRDFGIDVVTDAPGVGQNLQDHPMTSVVFKASEAALPAVRRRDLNIFSAVVRTDPSAAEPDMLLVFGDGPYFSPALNGPADAYVICCSLMKPLSRGSVRLAAPDITVPPLVNPNYLDDQADVDRLLAGLRMAREIGNRQSLKAWNGGEIFPGPSARDDAVCTDYLRVSIMPHFHPVGTCRMGSDREAVVDPQLRVRGVEGLRVADASVMPSIVSANTNATVLAIAERAAALIKAPSTSEPERPRNQAGLSAPCLTAIEERDNE
jgi:choline dehydrogenase